MNDRRLVIRDVRVVDVRSGHPGEAVDVLVRDGTIGSIGRVEPREGDEVLDGAGGYLAPGLIDGHVHLVWDGGPDPVAADASASDESRLRRARAGAEAARAAGITTVRDLGGPVTLARAAAEWRTSGGVQTADVIAAGPPFTRTDGHLALFGGAVADVTSARARLASALDDGIRAVKLVLSGGGLTPGTDPSRAELPEDIARAVSEGAHEAGLRVAAHCHATAAVRLGVAIGVDTIEHASCVDADGVPRFDPELASAIADAGIAVSPTAVGAVRTAASHRASGSDDAATRATIARLDARSAFIGRWAECGVRIVAGSDAGVTDTPFDSLLDEISIISEAGIGPGAALRSATSDAAEALGLEDRGEISEGRRADLVLLEADPTRSVDALRLRRAVVAGGVVSR